jgi:tetratricopeptide (TPR) repeat protein
MWRVLNSCFSKHSITIRTSLARGWRSGCYVDSTIDWRKRELNLQKAIALAPHFAPAFWILGTTLILLGQPDAAILETEKGLRLSPSRAAVPIAYTILSQGHLLLGHVEQAVELARKACAGNPRLYFTHMCLAAALGLEGSLDEARAALAEAIKLRPEFDSLIRLRVLHLGQSPVLGVTRDNDRSRPPSRRYARRVRAGVGSRRERTQSAFAYGRLLLAPASTWSWSRLWQPASKTRPAGCSVALALAQTEAAAHLNRVLPPARNVVRAMSMRPNAGEHCLHRERHAILTGSIAIGRSRARFPERIGLERG